MISRELEAEILRLYHAEGWRVGTLARQLHVHYSAVRRVLSQAGVTLRPQRPRPSMLDPYAAFIQDTFARYRSLRASRLYQMVRERGYRGGPDHFRHCVARWRPRRRRRRICVCAPCLQSRLRSTGPILARSRSVVPAAP